MTRATGLRAALADGDAGETACALCNRRLTGDEPPPRGDGGERPPAEGEVVVLETSEARTLCCGPCYRRALDGSDLRPRRVFKTGRRRRVVLAGE